MLYHINQISKDEEGSYSCKVNTEGFESEKSLQLDVKCEYTEIGVQVFRTKLLFIFYDAIYDYYITNYVLIAC